jgi:hypothetical protein
MLVHRKSRGRETFDERSLFDERVFLLELGTWNLELGTLNFELGTWNLELGTFQLCIKQIAFKINKTSISSTNLGR